MKRWHWLALAALCGIALCLTRYAGLAFVLGIGLFLRSWRDRLVVWGVPCILAVTGLLFTDFARPHFPTEAITAFGSLIKTGAGVSLVASHVVLLLLVVGLVVHEWSHRLVRLLVGGVAAYILMLMGMAVTQRFDPTLDMRLFVPITALLYLLGVGLTFRQGRRLVPYLLCGIAVHAIVTAGIIGPTLMNPDEKALNSRNYFMSQAMEQIRNAPDSVAVYSNNPYAVYLHTGRVVKGIPHKTTHADQNPLLKSTVDEVLESGGLMVWFQKASPHYLPPDSFTDYASTIRRGFDKTGELAEVAIELEGRSEE